MKHTKKILALLLSLCMLAAFLPMISLAADGEAYAVYNGTAGTLTFCVGELEADGVHRAAGGDPVSGNEYYTGFLTETYSMTSSGGTTAPWNDIRGNVTAVTFLDTVAPVSTALWFRGFSKLTAVQGADRLNTSNVKSMASMFDFCPSLTSLNVGSWNTGSVTRMSSMFSGCYSLTSLDIGSWSTGSVTDMNRMFEGCYSLTSLDLSSWNTGSVTDMQSMFYSCNSLTSLNVGNWNTGSVTTMASMFNGCSSLTSLDVGSWSTGSVTDMQYMFNGCSSLTSLNVSSWNTGSVTDMSNMFSPSLSSLTLGENFSFVSGTNCALPDVPNDSVHTGKWSNQTVGLTKTSQELMADYNGATMAGTWVWQPRRIDISGATVSPIADQSYTGEALTPAVTVTLNGTELQKDRDYTVDYQNNTAPGTATVIITGIHDYKGQAFGSFEIVGAPKPGLNFFQKIVQFFKNLFAKIKAFFEGLKK
ncbi:MAG: BspA family leucine-rich repeat surface protein [Clostridia bacterium]|nr:BspA family leucine-rich repeat surface protein [Clostridia bacterium]